MSLRTAFFRIAPLSLAAVSAMAAAQIDGPAPLAWRWSQSTSVSPTGSPAVLGDAVFVAVGGRIYGVEKALGTQMWRYPAGEPLSANFRSGVAFADGLVVAAADNNTVYAVEAATGREKWQYVSPDPIAGSIAVGGGYAVMALGGNGVMALRLADGQPVWKDPYKVPTGMTGSLGTHGGSALIFTQDNELMSVGIATQRRNWVVRFGSLPPDAKVSALGDVLYVNSGTRLAALSATTGGKRWEQDLGENLAYAPAVSADGIAVVSRDGRFYSLDVNGRFMIRRGADLQSLPVTDPAMVGRFAAVMTSNGSLNLIDPRTGDIIWNYIVRPLSGLPPATDPNAPTYVTAAGPVAVSGGTLLLLGRDGSLLAFDKANGVDLTPPQVRMVFPNAGDQVSGQPPLALVFRVSDEASGLNLNSVKVEIDGQAAVHEVTREGVVAVRISASGANRPLTDGRKTIVVTASDWLGNVAKQSFAITIDNTLRPVAPPTGTTGGAGNDPGAGGGPGRGGGPGKGGGR